jgi:hypothetical protein
MTSPPTLESRLARVEQVIAAVSREVAAIRAELGAPSPSQDRPLAAPPSVAAPAPRAPRQVRSLDFERLLGRYGMLGIAVFAAVAAVGTFLSWAISHGYLVLGPAARVALGLAFAAAISAWGLRLRRTERSFGSSLIGLALVIVLVCAYAAGPSFRLVPTWLAFIGAASVAWGLAIFARSQDDEPLWCVAFGGGAIAPFVTSDGSGNLYALLAYGFVLLIFGCFGIGNRRWPIAWRVFYLSSALIALSSDWLARVHGAPGLLATLAFPLAVGGAGVIPFAPASRKRAALRWLALLALVASVGANLATYSSLHLAWTTREQWEIAGAIVAAVMLWMLIVDKSSDVAQSSLLAATAFSYTLLDWIDVAFVPLLFTYQAASVLSTSGHSAFVYVACTAMFCVFLWRRSVSAARDASAFAVMTIAVSVLAEMAPPSSALQVGLLLGLVLCAFALHALRPSRSWVGAGAAVLVLAFILNLGMLVERPIYSFTPFATVPSLTALGVTATLAVMARLWRVLFDATREAMGKRHRRTYVRGIRSMLRVVLAAPWVWAFLWVLIELSMAYSASTSTLLLVTYFATTAVASVAAGRMRNEPRVRQVGLALAIAAAATAVYGASTYFNSGIRIVAYLVTSAFLLGIAYWYRQPGTSTTTGASHPPTPGFG